MINVDCHGNVSSFSPELLGLKHLDYDDFIVGNIHTIRWKTCVAVEQ